MSESRIQIADVSEKDNSCFGMPFGTSCKLWAENNNPSGYCDNNICIKFPISVEQQSKMIASVNAWYLKCF